MTGRTTTLTDLELLIAVANTAHVERAEDDELAAPAAVHAWWHGLGQPSAAAPADPGAVAVLRTLRAVIRALALRNNGIDTPVDVTALDGVTLRPDLSGLPGLPGLRAASAGDLAADIGAATFAALLRASAHPSWPRVKACRGEDCRWVFVDGSRNSSRRWCDMAACGNRAKSAAFRERHAH